MLSKQKLIDQLRKNFPFLSDEYLNEKALSIEQLQTNALSGDLNDRLAYALALEKAKFVEAVPVLRELAEQGNAMAQYHLGLAYATGGLLYQDSSLYFEWVAKAAEAGLKDAQREMAFIYRNGETVPKNIRKVFYWQIKASEHGEPQDLCELADLYMKEGNEPSDYEKAFYLYQTLVEHGYENALPGLANAYANGYGVRQDERKAAELFARANMEAEAISIYRKLRDMRSVFELTKKLAERGDPDAQHNLGGQYFFGQGVDKSMTDAIYWFERSAKSVRRDAPGVSASMQMLEFNYRTGLFMGKPDPEKAEMWHREFETLMNELQKN